MEAGLEEGGEEEVEEEEEHKAGRMADVRISCRRKTGSRKSSRDKSMKVIDACSLHAKCHRVCVCLPSEL